MLCGILIMFENSLKMSQLASLEKFRICFRAANFPENFHFPGTGIPELFREIPGNSRELQTYYITNKKYPIFERKCNFLAYYNDFQL